MATSAKKHGVQIRERSSIRKVLLSDQRQVYAVDTDEGLIETNNFVNAAGAVSVFSQLYEKLLEFRWQAC